jgi:Redoxin
MNQLRSGRVRLILAAAVLACVPVCFLSAEPAEAALTLPAVDGAAVDPVAPTAGVRATVVVFISAECPVSNRYAPELRRLRDKYGAQGVRFFPVYANPAEGAAAIAQHLRDYGYPGRALRDPVHAFVKRVGAQVTPEAALFDAAGTLVYHGRIDNRYASLGVERPAATVHDLDDAVAATLAGRAVADPVTQAVGCYLADFAR